MSERQTRAHRRADTGPVMRRLPERCYRFMRSRDPRYDGFFFVGVTSTGIYCRPSCPARLPAAPQRAPVRLGGRGPGRGLPRLQALRAGRRARLAGVEPARRRGRPRVPLIADGIVDREGVSGLAARLGFERQLSTASSWPRSAPVPPSSPAHSAPRPRADRVDRTALRGGRARVRLRQHPPVQRHDPGDLRAHPERAARRAAGGAGRRRPAQWSCACRPPAARRRRPARLPGRALRPGIERVEGGTYSRSLPLRRRRAGGADS